MWLGIKNVIRANHMISLITSSTTDPRILLWTRGLTDQPYNVTVKVVKTLTQELQVNYLYTVLII
jgi:hypothetical protein